MTGSPVTCERWIARVDLPAPPRPRMTTRSTSVRLRISLIDAKVRSPQWSIRTAERSAYGRPFPRPAAAGSGGLWEAQGSVDGGLPSVGGPVSAGSSLPGDRRPEGGSQLTIRGPALLRERDLRRSQRRAAERRDRPARRTRRPLRRQRSPRRRLEQGSRHGHRSYPGHRQDHRGLTSVPPTASATRESTPV